MRGLEEKSVRSVGDSNWARRLMSGQAVCHRPVSLGAREALSTKAEPWLEVRSSCAFSPHVAVERREGGQRQAESVWWTKPCRAELDLGTVVYPP
jgi:hypothetical protein